MHRGPKVPWAGLLDGHSCFIVVLSISPYLTDSLRPAYDAELNACDLSQGPRALHHNLASTVFKAPKPQFKDLYSRFGSCVWGLGLPTSTDIIGVTSILSRLRQGHVHTGSKQWLWCIRWVKWATNKISGLRTLPLVHRDCKYVYKI